MTVCDDISAGTGFSEEMKSILFRLAGEYDISPFEAGYGWAVKLDREFFIGKTAMQQRAGAKATSVRIVFSGRKGIRPIRSGDGLGDSRGKCIGWVTSCAKVGDNQIALGYLVDTAMKKNDPVGVYYLARGRRQIEQGRKENVHAGEVLEMDVEGKIVSRFARF